ncbi:Ni/Fe hydrogenase subunit alpha [Geomonas paludis]|uniref:Methyl viologen-reducing hydrogenase n=1 Tax=Geomonas paludis TaxID=2740185 RepID=A0A6V8N0J3_9BACT|nr:Ni/Fe hydrogenase subunit alpha [Geomonas paludis]UPU36903.1 Ni/Fe hydrogenase subunit alpha [Geomonas paludis]GFO65574.1 methyl viologen-reducing hydrogenase [Geomonas paludis]
MKKTLKIDPVTRIEGHAKVFIDLDAAGKLESAGLVVNELRGFEKILIGMEADRMPHVTARICGVCPTAHHLAACNALDNAAGVAPPPAALLLRELMYLGHIIHSHSLSIFVLQGPDLVLGLDAEPGQRNIVGIVAANPELAKMALALRSIGQRINEMVGGRGTHPVTSVAGGIAFVLEKEKHKVLKGWVAEAKKLLPKVAPAVKGLLLKALQDHPAMAADWVVPSWGLGTVHEDRVSLIQGKLRAIDEQGAARAEFGVEEYHRYLQESVVEWSYMKKVRLNLDGELHDYRVGPMARMNVARRFGTELADAEYAEFCRLGGTPCHTTVFQTYAKLIEIIWAVERAEEILREKEIWGETRVPVRFQGGRGVGHVEAPRGTLIHDYQIDDQGIVRSANLIVATQQNYSIINRSIEQSAQSHVIDRPNDQALMNAVEFSIRCYDPCLSCATHAVGRMPMQVIIRKDGETVRTLRR